MGALDDAIREHLELKRRLGTSEEELKRKEDEAFGRGRPPPAVAEVTPEADAGPQKAAETPVEAPLPPDVGLPEAPEPEAVAAEPALEPRPAEPAPPEDFEPDEVLPEEALEPAGGEVPADDVLEETPDFLEEAPDQERLWFEQKPPKDFDFDD
jgi:hypothetical protein